jgi:hypothetical protein
VIRRVLGAGAAGALLGVAVALLLHAAIRNTPVQIPPQRLAWGLFSLSLSGAIAGLALSSVIALQARNPDPAYRARGTSNWWNRRPGPTGPAPTTSPNPPPPP